MFGLKLPDFEIIVWIDYNDFGKKLEKKILSITRDLEVCDDIERDGKRVYHWIVPSWLDTLVLGGQLKKFAENPNLIFLKLRANNDSKAEKCKQTLAVERLLLMLELLIGRCVGI